MAAYYNEFDSHAAAWLRQLIKLNLIADGEVDERSIVDVSADDLKGFTQHHFFAGIGGWSYALRLAEIPDTEPLWTASLPCQPFSTAGKQLGKSDERHLLPHFIELVRQCRPKRIFGEQVPGAIRHGWLDDLHTEMEQENYSVRSCVLTAAGAGAYHIRQRLYWVADSEQQGVCRRPSSVYSEEAEIRDRKHLHNSFSSSFLSGVADSKSLRSRKGQQNSKRSGERVFKNVIGEPVHICQSRMGNSQSSGYATSSSECSQQYVQWETDALTSPSWTSIWSDPEWLYCQDGKYRPIKSSVKPLVDGVSRGVGYSSDPSSPITPNETQEARVMRLKGYGNAIVPQVAAVFIRASYLTEESL